MDDMIFDAYTGLMTCTGEGSCDNCPYKDVDDMECIDALMLDCAVILEEVMCIPGDEGVSIEDSEEKD